MLKVHIILLFFIGLLILSAIFNDYLPKWFCDKMGWHVAPEAQGFDGCSLKGQCPRCGKHVLQDSQGNWF